MIDPRRWLSPLASITALLVAAGGLGLVATARRGAGTYRVTAYFEKAIGLFPNSDVDILGVPVGKVTAVVPAGSTVRVDMEIDARYRVPAGAIAQIVPISVISDRYVQLAPVYQGTGPVLRDGDVIGVERTYIPAELDDVFKQLRKLLEAIEPGRPGRPGALGELIVQLDRALRGREEDLKTTLITGSDLVRTLGEARGDIDAVLVNLESLFERLATRAGRLGSLNRNLALVMSALASSRDDLTGTLANLAGMTEEVGSLLERHGDRLGRDLELAARITATVLDNRASVEEALQWLPTVARGASAAFHGGRISAVDVRDNATARVECALLDHLPPGPIRDGLQRFCRDETGEPRPRRAAVTDAEGLEPERELDCDRGVRRVRRQLHRLRRAGLPQTTAEGILTPLAEQLERLERRCRRIAASVEPGGLIDRLLEQLPVLGEPGDESPLGELPGLAGASSAVAVPAAVPGPWQRLTGWFGGFLGFLGVGS